MNEVVLFLAAPTVMCLILAVIHCYLGLHVLARGVIFVDLSLAQVASFGATLALLWTGEHESSATYFVSLGATFVAAALFALARRFEHRFSQEAVIGIVYALASAAVILVVDRLAHGAEHLKEALVGQVLWVSWSEVIKTGLIYSVVGAIHFIFRKQFLAASQNHGANHGAGHGANHAAPQAPAHVAGATSGAAVATANPQVAAISKAGAHSGVTPENSWFWDFLFYALFGVVITSSTHVAGVLMVFSFLIVPSILGQVFFKTIRGRLLFGWSLSTVLSVFGMYASFKLDVPVGALIVVLFASLPILALIGFGVKSLFVRESKRDELDSETVPIA